MCFSATASFIAGGALVGMGGKTLSMAKTKFQIPYASIPLLFGVQQLIEGTIWLTFGSGLLLQVMTLVYSIFAFVLWPIFVPFSVLLIEPDARMRKFIKVFLILGTITGLYLFYLILKSPVTPEIIQNCIAYHSDAFNNQSLLIASTYFVTSSVSCFFSSHKRVKLFGLALMVSAYASYTLYRVAFFSVWCFFAALLSVIVYSYFYKKREKALKKIRTK
jgi:hypothetical protein